MALKTKWLGRDQLRRTFDLLSPNVLAAVSGVQMRIAQDLADKIKKYAPVVSGQYRESINADRLENHPGAQLKGINVSKDPNATGVFGAWYWRFIEFGTRPHSIPKGGGLNAKYMVFEGREGSLKFVRSVNHPGSPAQPHIFPVYRAEKKNIRRRLSRAVNRAVKKAVANQQATEQDGEV